jgi:uncharacterized protein (UPF0305 family)
MVQGMEGVPVRSGHSHTLAADSYKNGNDQIVPVSMSVPSNSAAYPGADPVSFRRVREAVCRMGECRTRGELGEAIAQVVEKYSLAELQAIGGSIRNEVDRLPAPYREKIRPYFQEQFFGTHHRLLCGYRSGDFRLMQEPITDPETFRKFLAMIPDGCFANQAASGTEFGFGEPVRSLFYYLLSAYTMFVMDGPGHPVGTPFPGGFIVEQRGGEYFCPIRDKEEEIPFSICNFCPAKQMEGV